ncbi:MAG: UDP-glucose 4-epimerase GalE, partial [Phycisphaerales bacterium JB041]
MRALKPGDARPYNLGIGTGSSVRELIDSVKRVTGVDYEDRAGQRRPGDPPKLFANPAKIKAELGWEARFQSLDEIVATAWNWFREHPRGYGS